jgi:uncharacterized protein DUF6527
MKISMNQKVKLTHKFVEFIPEGIEDWTIYVSIDYATAVHKCCCGCGQEVVTPLSPIDWKLIFDGRSISLYPSIGNWSFSCQSHYWIKNNIVTWAPKWSQEEIDAGRYSDSMAKDIFFDNTNTLEGHEKSPSIRKHGFEGGIHKIWHKFIRWVFK